MQASGHHVHKHTCRYNTHTHNIKITNISLLRAPAVTWIGWWTKVNPFEKIKEFKFDIFVA